MSGKPTRAEAIIALGAGEDALDDDLAGHAHEHHAKKKSGAQLDREIATALTKQESNEDDVDAGVFYLTDTKERPLGPEFSSRTAAKRAAMKIVREGAHPRVEVWHHWRGGRYMQGLANEEGWSDV